MPSPKWKLVVDIGDVEETVSVPIAAAASGVVNSAADHSENTSERLDDVKEPAVHPSTVGSTETGIDDRSAQQQYPAHAATSNPPVASASSVGAPSIDGKDPRIDAVVALLGEYMPSDPTSQGASFVSGFMSLRLLLLRPTRAPDEEDLVRTMLNSFSSLQGGGRPRSEIASMLARDFMFMNQQNQQQHQPPAAMAQQQHHHQQQHQASMLSLENSMMQGGAHQAHMASQSNSAGLSLFGLPSTSSSLQNSPALAPIPVPGSHDSMSIVSN